MHTHLTALHIQADPGPEPRLLHKEQVTSARTPGLLQRSFPSVVPRASLLCQLGTQGMERKGWKGGTAVEPRDTSWDMDAERGKEANNIHAHQKADKTTAIIKFHYDS